jgi:hypothetical protein
MVFQEKLKLTLSRITTTLIRATLSTKLTRTTKATTTTTLTAAATTTTIKKATTVRATKRSYPSCLCKNSAAILNGPVPPMLWAQNALPSLIA